MKTKTKFSFAGVAGFALALGSLTHAQTPAFQTSATGTTNTSAVAPLSSSDQAFSVSNLTGKPVRGANQEQLGDIGDFVIDPTSGKISYAIVPTGAGASGQTFRLIPAAAFQTGTGQDGLTIALNKSQWEQVGTMTEQELNSHVSLQPDQLDRLNKQFSLNAQQAGAQNGVRASKLKGQPLRAGNDQVGTVDDVLVDLGRQSAAAVVTAANGGQKVVVPFTQLQAGTDGQSLTTNLTRNDFQSMTPTGYSSATFPQSAQANDPTATAVQQALGNSGIQVSTENRIVLRGTVTSEQAKSDAARRAAAAAPNAPIDNQIMVRRW